MSELYGPPHVSALASRYWRALVEDCFTRRVAVPDWSSAGRIAGVTRSEADNAFEELSDAGVFDAGIPSAIAAIDRGDFRTIHVRPVPRERPSGPEWAKLRSTVFARDDYRCTYCGTRGGRLECDHVVPVARGGAHDLSNLATACLPCNRDKGTKLLSEWQP